MVHAEEQEILHTETKKEVMGMMARGGMKGRLLLEQVALLNRLQEVVVMAIVIEADIREAIEDIRAIRGHHMGAVGGLALVVWALLAIVRRCAWTTEVSLCRLI
ncbi:hypothetical protein EAH_00056760 [Eimeria acervulina]|uniref:Uncharacterized protein n=1 Tax=Eimeria acervulina TaxID=5801 RepID=U6GKW4_EIMAC|nr:hypothetical protein EAH_00056760 [Eimeria acervulina]CDI80866.1 hypothetical protein EAH_00056760 [Eimeria acervulina]